MNGSSGAFEGVNLHVNALKSKCVSRTLILYDSKVTLRHVLICYLKVTIF